jgi:hypothetical protein
LFGASADHKSEEEVGGNWKAGVREVGLRRGDLLGPEGGWASSYTANFFPNLCGECSGSICSSRRTFATRTCD